MNSRSSLPRRRTTLVVLTLLFPLGSAAPSRSDRPEAPPAAAAGTAPQPAPAVAPTPTIDLQPAQGSAPAVLLGRWLLVAQLEAEGGGRQTMGLQLAFRGDAEGRLLFDPRLVPLPAGTAAAIDDANRRGLAWQPAAAELREVAENWSRGEPDPRTTVVRSGIYGPGALPEDIADDGAARAALAVFNFNQLAAGVGMSRWGAVFLVDKVAPDRFEGRMDSVMLLLSQAGAFPVRLSGRYVAYRVPERASGGTSTTATTDARGSAPGTTVATTGSSATAAAAETGK